MNTSAKTLLTALFFFMGINKIQAQTEPSTLNQVELMKKFLGNWTGELGKDTFMIAENTPFGTGMVSTGQIVTKGETLDSVIQLYGYDKINDRFTIAELVRSSSVLEIINARFHSENTGELVVTNTDNGKFEWKFEFKSPDLIVQTALINGKILKEISLTRIKSAL